MNKVTFFLISGLALFGASQAHALGRKPHAPVVCPDIAGEWDHGDYRYAGYVHHTFIAEAWVDGVTVYTIREAGAGNAGAESHAKPIPVDQQRDLYHTFKHTTDASTYTVAGPFSADSKKTIAMKDYISRCEDGALVTEQPFGHNIVVIYRYTPKTEDGVRKLILFEGKRAPNEPNSAAVGLAGNGETTLLKVLE